MPVERSALSEIKSVTKSRYDFLSVLFHSVGIREMHQKNENGFGWPIDVPSCQPKGARPEVMV